MINSLLGSAFLDILKNEWLGIVASAFILVSFLFTKQTITRIINMIGCVVFVVYGLLLPTYSTAFMNGALFIVHIVYLIKDYLARKKNNDVVNIDQNVTQQIDITNSEENTKNKHS